MRLTTSQVRGQSDRRPIVYPRSSTGSGSTIHPAAFLVPSACQHQGVTVRTAYLVTPAVVPEIVTLLVLRTVLVVTVKVAVVAPARHG